MNETVNKFLLTGDKFLLEMLLKQPGFTYSACGLFTKNKEKILKFMLTGNTNYIYKTDLDKAYFQHDMAYGENKDLTKRTQLEKVLRDKAFKIASNPKYDAYQCGLTSMVYEIFDKNPKVSAVRSSDLQIFKLSNQKLSDKLHKSITRTL